MGIDVYVLKFLCELRERFGPLGRVLQIGKQEMFIDPALLEPLNPMLATIVPGGIPLDVLTGERFADRLLTCLGADEISALDYSSYEGADIIADLNENIDVENYSKFDTIFDGGTLEHVFNFPVALANLMRLTKVGGRLALVNGANNFLGHGLYQFSPDLFYRAFSNENGFVCRGIYLVDKNGTPDLTPAVDPFSSGSREEIGTTPRPVYLMAIGERIREVRPFMSSIQQSDYVSAWNAVDS